MSIKVSGKRKREVGLVVPARYTAITENKRQAEILLDELAKVRISELKLKQDSVYASPVFV